MFTLSMLSGFPSVFHFDQTVLYSVFTLEILAATVELYINTWLAFIWPLKVLD